MSDPLPTIAETLAQAERQLSRRPDAEPGIEAEVLLCHTLGRPRTHLVAWPDKRLGSAELQQFDELLARRLAGEPIAYITGRKEFWSLELEVSPATLIPRPETEHLVERALELIPADSPWLIADLGTGSGAIALAIARERPGCHIIATDQSADALEVARRNAQRHDTRNVEFLQGTWFQAIPPDIRLNLILSNPPYVAENDPHLQRGDLPWEPSTALSSGADGLDDIRQIAAQAAQYLTPHGGLILEHGYDQGKAVRQILADSGFGRIRTLPDLESRDRLSEGFLER
ncbi:MAG: peptide chain release factor N(5)-glutamine methyltransferase [Sedimenticola sp.]